MFSLRNQNQNQIKILSLSSSSLKMGYLSCRAESSIATCRSSSSSVSEPRRRPHIRHFTYGELASATGNFSEERLLGRGSHGSVYKAVLPGDPRPLAVKRPSRRPSPSREVDNEIRILSRIRSPRLVNLVGFAPNSSHSSSLMVVEFMPNGTLYDLLHSNSPPLPNWSRRLRLALQTAKAILALHSQTPPVVHRDVKSANVLIDRRSNARLCDFGLALYADDASSTPPAGTLGYLDPAYVTPDSLSTKTDVFSFGILLLEIISGRKAIDVAHSPPSVVDWAIPLLKRGKVTPLFDPRIPPPRDPAARRQLASLAASCVRSCRDRRPAMNQIVDQLKILAKTVPARPWNGPCAVVDIRLDSNNPNSDQEETALQAPVGIMLVKVPSSENARSGRNLLDLMARPDQNPIRVISSDIKRRSSISRARSLHVTRDYYGRDKMLVLRRNHTVKGSSTSKPSSRLNMLDNLDGKLCDQAKDSLCPLLDKQ